MALINEAIKKGLGKDFYISNAEREKAQKSIEGYIGRIGQIDPDCHISTEQKLEFPISGVGNFLSIIDRVDRIEDTAILIDYKTGKDWQTYGLQSVLYTYGALSSYRWAKSVIFRLEFLDLGITKDIELKPSELSEKIKEVKNIIENINNERFNPVISEACRYCMFKNDCKYVKRKDSANEK
jgi:hypothetical protein